MRLYCGRFLITRPIGLGCALPCQRREDSVRTQRRQRAHAERTACHARGEHRTRGFDPVHCVWISLFILLGSPESRWNSCNTGWSPAAPVLPCLKTSTTYTDTAGRSSTGPSCYTHGKRHWREPCCSRHAATCIRVGMFVCTVEACVRVDDSVQISFPCRAPHC
jgi:hypothetical protein